MGDKHIYLDHIDYLRGQLATLQTKLPITQLYAVGGCVRDILLQRTTSPSDIDVTCAGEPIALGQSVDQSGIDFFQTEKFGTFTIIPHDQERDDPVNFEVTPFRAEGVYTDLRHPDQLEWTNDLLLDSERRDFTINALYYTAYTFDHLAGYETSETDELDRSTLLASLDERGVAFDRSTCTLIIQKHALIQSCFGEGVVDESYLFSVIKMLSPLEQPRTVDILIDPQQGLHDLYHRRIRCVGSADQRLQEDALRIVRGLRFGTALAGFDYEKHTWQALHTHHELLREVARERIGQEIMKSLKSDNFFGFVSLLDETGLLPHLFPHIAQNKHNDQPTRYHPFDTYTHTMLTLYHLEQLTSDPTVKLGMLYHDCAKKQQYHIMTQTETRSEAYKQYGDLADHSKHGATLVKQDLSPYGWGKKTIADVQRYVRHHMRPGEILMGHPDRWKKKLRQLYADAGYERVRNLLDIVIGDRRGQYNPLGQGDDNVEEVYLLIDILEELKSEEGQFTLKQLAVDGNDIMRHLKLAPSREIRDLLQQAHTWVMEDIAERNHHDVILEYLVERRK